LIKLVRIMFNRIVRPSLHPGQSLHGNQLLIARVLSALVIIGSMAFFVVSLPARIAYLNRITLQAAAVFQRETNLGSTTIQAFSGFYLPMALVIEIGVMLLYLFTAILIYTRRSEDWLALLTAASFVAFALHITPALNTWMGDNPVHIWIGSLAKGIGLGLAFLFLYLFPGGYYSPSWMRVFLPVWIVWVVLWLVRPDSILSFRDPYTISVEGFILLMIWWGIGIFSQIYRFAYVSSPLERQQTKTLTFGATIVLIAYSAYVPLREAMSRQPQPELAQTVFQLIAPYIFLILIGAIPITITFSILRYRLWDIDLLIRRTLIYSILSVTLLVIYLFLIVSLQIFVSDWMEGLPNYALAGTTLAVVVLFNPLRHRIQDSIDRRFYRHKYNAEKALENFASLARNEADIHRLSSSLVGVVQEALQPEQVSLWLPVTSGSRVAAKRAVSRYEKGDLDE
jgi:hypothetical protein